MVLDTVYIYQVSSNALISNIPLEVTQLRATPMQWEEVLLRNNLSKFELMRYIKHCRWIFYQAHHSHYPAQAASHVRMGAELFDSNRLDNGHEQ